MKKITMERVLELSQSGLSLKEIAEHECVSISTIYNRIKKSKGTEEYRRYKETIKGKKRRTRGKKITLEKIIELSQSGLTLKEIAEHEGVSIFTICNRIKESKGTEEYRRYKETIKGKKRRTKGKKITLEKIIELSQLGLTLEKIAEHEGVSIFTIWNRIKESKGTEEYRRYKETIKGKKRRTRGKKITLEKIIELSKAGLTLEKIAEHEGVSIFTIWNRIKESKGIEEYQIYRDVIKGRKKETKIGNKVRLSNKQLILFMLKSGSTAEEASKCLCNKGIEVNVRNQLEEYIKWLRRNGRRTSVIQNNMVGFIKRLLKIQAKDVEELERIVTNSSLIHKVTSRTTVDNLLWQYNTKSRRNFSKLEIEFILNRIKTYNLDNKGSSIVISPLIDFGTERVEDKIEGLYDSIELDDSYTLNGEEK